MPLAAGVSSADLKGLACIKCHAVGKEGGSVGPELSSVGAKYPRDELIASVLFPSAKISSGYEPSTFALADGRVITGIVRNETADAVEIQDADAKTIRIAKDDIDERKRSDVSLMPNGPGPGLEPPGFRRPDRLSRDAESSQVDWAGHAPVSARDSTKGHGMNFRKSRIFH